MNVDQIDHFNLEDSNKIETKLKEQNETKPKLVQAEKKTKNSKTSNKLVYTKYQKGKRPIKK